MYKSDKVFVSKSKSVYFKLKDFSGLSKDIILKEFRDKFFI